MVFGGSIVTLGRDEAAHLRLRAGDGLLSCGKKTAPMRFGLGEAAGLLEVPLSLLNLFGLAGVEKHRLGFYRGRDGVPRLGPVVAALSSFPPSALPSTEASFMGHLARHCRERGIYFHVMMPEQADFKTRLARGFLLSSPTSNGLPAWEERPVPLPDIVFNQVTSLAPQQTDPYGRLNQSYSARPAGYPTFLTRGWLDKTRAFRLLAADDLAAEYVPRTQTLGPSQALWDMLDQFGQVYLKPEQGSHGLNIIRLSARDGHFLAEFRAESENAQRVLASKDEVESFLAPALAQATYVCQQAVRRPQLNGGEVDFRVILAKNGQDQWEVCFYRGKTAPAGAICTNWGYGSTWWKLDSFLGEVFPGREQAVADALGQCGLAVAGAVSGPEGGDCCQLAVDVALDLEGRPWVFEVNDRPEHYSAHGAKVASLLAEYFLLCAGGQNRVLVRILPVAG